MYSIEIDLSRGLPSECEISKLWAYVGYLFIHQFSRNFNEIFANAHLLIVKSNFHLQADPEALHWIGRDRRTRARQNHRLRQLCEVHKVVNFYPLRLYRHTPTRIDSVCEPQHTMLLHIDWPNRSTLRWLIRRGINPWGLQSGIFFLYGSLRSSWLVLWASREVYDPGRNSWT